MDRLRVRRLFLFGLSIAIDWKWTGKPTRTIAIVKWEGNTVWVLVVVAPLTRWWCRCKELHRDVAIGRSAPDVIAADFRVPSDLNPDTFRIYGFSEPAGILFMPSIGGGGGRTSSCDIIHLSKIAVLVLVPSCCDDNTLP
jgi:hypothetical protein